MTANADYSYVSLELPFNATSIKDMVKAVRVKLGVKEKLSKNFKPIEKQEESLDKINEILDGLEKQKKLKLEDAAKVKRVVLFTAALADRYKNIFRKKYFVEDKKEAVNDNVNVGVENMAIPNNWENVESTELENNFKNEAQAEIAKMGESVASVAPEMPTIESATTEISSLEPVQAGSVEEKSVESALPEMPAIDAPVEPKVIENEVPVASIDFAMPSFEFEQKVEEPTTEIPTVESATDENSKMEMPSFEFNTNKETPNVEIPEPAIINSEEKVESDAPSMSIEDKIASLLNRESNIPVAEEKSEELKIPSQADVMARIQKTKNALKDKDAEITTLKNKVDELNDKYVSTRAKLEGYNAVIRDVTAKYDTAARSNEELSSKYEQLEETLKAKVATLEEQLKESQQARVVESEKSKQIIADLKSSHTKEIEELNKTNNQRIQSIKEEKDRQLKDAYSSILDVLSPSEETYKKVA